MNVMECKECYAVPGADSILDVINPRTGLTWYFGKTLDQVQAEDPGAVRMTVDAFCAQKAIRQHSPITWDETTEELYWDALEALPPAAYGKDMKGFLLGEPQDHDAETGQPRFSAYLKRAGKYLASSRPMTIKEFREVTA